MNGDKCGGGGCPGVYWTVGNKNKLFKQSTIYYG